MTTTRTPYSKELRIKQLPQHFVPDSLRHVDGPLTMSGPPNDRRRPETFVPQWPKVSGNSGHSTIIPEIIIAIKFLPENPTACWHLTMHELRKPHCVVIIGYTWVQKIWLVVNTWLRHAFVMITGYASVHVNYWLVMSLLWYHYQVIYQAIYPLHSLVNSTINN